MSKLKKNNEYGLSLVELLAYIVLASIISIFTFSIIINSLNTNKKIVIEAAVRDEADLIMSNLMKSIYSLKESKVQKLEMPSNNSKSLIYTSSVVDACEDPSKEIYKTTCFITGFETIIVDSKEKKILNIENKKYEPSNPYITLNNQSKITVSNGANSKVSYNVSLVIDYDNGKFSKTYYFENQIQSIQDLQK